MIAKYFIVRHTNKKEAQTMQVKEFEVKKMVEIGSIVSSVAVKSEEGYRLAFSTDSKKDFLKLVTQKKNERVFKSLEAVEIFLNRVGINSFHVK